MGETARMLRNFAPRPAWHKACDLLCFVFDHAPRSPHDFKKSGQGSGKVEIAAVEKIRNWRRMAAAIHEAEETGITYT